jgi:hypothetical protein
LICSVSRLTQKVDQVAFEVQEAQLEHGEQADGARSDNGDIGFNWPAVGGRGLDGRGSHVIQHLTSCIGWENVVLIV